MEPEDVVHVLRRFQELLVPGGLILDLQVIRPHPVVELEGRVLCTIDGSPTLTRADAAAAAVDDMVAAGVLIADAIDDHDVLRHYASGASLVEDFATKERELPADAIPALERIDQPLVVRERCRLRRLRTALGRAPRAS
jgi:hypothetical protein